MQTSNRLLDDLAKMASGAFGTLGGIREEIETRVRERVERFAAEMDLVPREEFEAVREMAQKARAEQETLMERIAALEARLESQGSSASASPEPATSAKPTATKRPRKPRIKPDPV